MIPNNPLQLEAATVVDLEPPVRSPATDEHRRIAAPLRKTHRDLERPPFEWVALVLQGGGALGAYQAGVYQAMIEARGAPPRGVGSCAWAVEMAFRFGQPA